MPVSALQRPFPHAVTDCLLDCVAERALHIANPYDHWVMQDMLPDKTVKALTQLSFRPSNEIIFSGKRDGYNNNVFRIYFTPENRVRFSICRDVVAGFQNPAVISALEAMAQTSLSQGHLRIEYCQDANGFWLEPHVDISIKLFSLIIYLSDDPALRDAGTDIYDDTSEHNLVSTISYEPNKGFLFIPGQNTWHGFTPRPIYGIRKSLIINYVSDEWRNKQELS